jgi:hypothetical protein
VTDTEPHDQDGATPHRPTWQSATFAAAYGAIAASLAYLIAAGNPLWMLAVMIAIGILFRLYAYTLIRRRGQVRPSWRKWL